MSIDYPITINALKNKVFKHTVAKTYLKFKEIAQIKTYDEGYQRKRDIEHEDKIIKYLEDNSNRYLPDIILVIRHDDIKFEEKVLLNNPIFKINEDSKGILKITLKNQISFENIKIIDGNHRVSAIKKLLQKSPISDLENLKIGVTFIFTYNRPSDFEDELALFYYLNSKAKPLLPNDYLNEATKNLTDAKAKEIDWWMYVFKKSHERFTEMFNDDFTDKFELEDTIIRACDYLAKKIEENDIETMVLFFDRFHTMNTLKLIDSLKIEFNKNKNFYNLINIFFYIGLKVTQGVSELVDEVNGFYKWIKNKAKLEEFDNFENLYKTYKETYIPEDYKIFVAMEFSNQNDVFKAINGVIEEVSKEIDKPLECIRIDKLHKGTTYQIMDEILYQIQHNRLLIADLTNMNANVYLEVGYAMGLARANNIDNQIMLFVKDEGNDTKVGFDLQSYHQNRYKDTEELREQLKTQLLEYYR